MAKTIRKIERQAAPAIAPRRVAAYARVSVPTERLLHSLDEQISYYSALIQNTPGWEYAGVFADRGISGTQSATRDQFQKMLAECEAGNIDIILTKSLSRFARKTVDTLETVRHLRSLGIEVRFEKEGINTLDESGELMITLFASFAQEESRSISENCKWGIRKRFRNGTMGVANKHLLGYRYDGDLQQYVIIPEEAEIIRLMFDLFLRGATLQEICDELNGRGCRTVNGKLFQEATVAQLLQNEVYAGDMCRQKSYMADPDKDPATLTAIPLALAGWLRYLLAVDDEGKPMAVSSDPMLATLQADLAGVTLGDPASLQGKLDGILDNAVLFGVSLKAAGLADKVTGFLAEMLAGPGAVRATLKKHLA